MDKVSKLLFSNSQLVSKHLSGVHKTAYFDFAAALIPANIILAAAGLVASGTL